MLDYIRIACAVPAVKVRRFRLPKKASQNLPQKRQTHPNIFDRGVYVGENTYQAASVEFVRL